jgi:hypothetical protein
VNIRCDDEHVFVMRSDGDYAAVRELVAAGVSDREIERRTGVPRSTVGTWRRRPRRRASHVADKRWRPPIGAPYCYVLGLYLGDGHVVRRGRSAWLRITLDARYPGVADEASPAMSRVFPESRVAGYERPGRGTIELQTANPALPQAFPQCGSDLLRPLRHARHPLDQVERSQHLDCGSRQRRLARHLRRPQGLTASRRLYNPGVTRGRGVTAAQEPSKLLVRVRLPSPASTGGQDVTQALEV